MTTLNTRTATAIDLEAEASVEERWDAIARRGEHIDEVITAVHREAATHVDRAVRRILSQVTGYERTGTVERDDLWWSVHRNLEAVLLAVAEQRSPSDADLAIRRELGRRRAQQGMPVEDIMRAFRIGYGVLWEVLNETAYGFGSAHSRALLDHAARIWMTFDEITSAVAEAHAEIVARQHVDRRRRSLGFLNGLQRLPEGHERTEELCRSLDLDPHAAFTIAVQDPTNPATSPADGCVTVEQSNRTVVIAAWDNDPVQAETALGELLRAPGSGCVGVGMTRYGLRGALQSLRDAERAHEAASACGAPLVHFRDSWLACLALADRTQLDALAAPAVQALTQDEGLHATLQSFLANAGNLSAVGKDLAIHPNTASYRLRQFAHRTGIDARTPAGMALVQVALAYAGRIPNGEPHVLVLPESNGRGD